MFALLGMSLLKDRMGYCDIQEKYGVSRSEVNLNKKCLFIKDKSKNKRKFKKLNKVFF
jgi:hypothetical protein